MNTLLPPVRRRTRYRSLLVASWTAGACAGALVTAALLGVGGYLLEASISPAWRLFIWCTGMVALLGSTIRGRGVPEFLPQAHRQIPQIVIVNRSALGAFRFGFELGTGVRTFLSSVTAYELALTLLMIGPNLSLVVAAAVTFGVGRSLIMWQRFASPQAQVSVAQQVERVAYPLGPAVCAVALAFALL